MMVTLYGRFKMFKTITGKRQRYHSMSLHRNKKIAKSKAQLYKGTEYKTKITQEKTSEGYPVWIVWVRGR